MQKHQLKHPSGASIVIRPVANPKEKKKYDDLVFELIFRPAGARREAVDISNARLRNSFSIVACLHDEIIGGGMFATNEIGEPEIKRLCVRPEYERGGIGTAILQMLEDFARKIGIFQVSVYLHPDKVDYYEKRDYRKEGENIYAVYGIHLIRMIKRL